MKRLHENVATGRSLGNTVLQRAMNRLVLSSFRFLESVNRSSVFLAAEKGLNQGLVCLKIEQLLMVLNALVWFGTQSVSGNAQIATGLLFIAIAVQVAVFVLNSYSNNKSQQVTLALKQTPKYLFLEVINKVELSIFLFATLSVLVVAVFYDKDAILALFFLLVLVAFTIGDKDQYTRYLRDMVFFCAFAWMKYATIKTSTFTVNYYNLEIPVNLSLLYGVYGLLDYVIMSVFLQSLSFLIYVHYELDNDKSLGKGEVLSQYTLDEFIESFGSSNLKQMYSIIKAKSTVKNIVQDVAQDVVQDIEVQDDL
jgi:hypothetical protein